VEKILKALERSQHEQVAGAVRSGIAEAVPFPNAPQTPHPYADKPQPAQQHAKPGHAEAPRPIRRTRVERVSERVLAANRLVAAVDGHPLGDTFRVLRTRVLQQLDDYGFSTLMVASPSPGEGKSTLAANLAISIAKLSARHVLLVDADLRRPRIHKLFGVGGTPGLSEYLGGHAAIDSCLVSPGIDRLVLLPAGRIARQSSELLANHRMAALADELKARYPDRVVIYDAPPLLASDDALIFGSYVDCGLLVAAEARTKTADLEKTFELMNGVPIIGTVLNRSSDTPEKYERS